MVVKRSPHSSTVAKLCFRTAFISLLQKCLGLLLGNTSQALGEKSWLIRVVRANLTTAVFLIIMALQVRSCTCSLSKKMWVENATVKLTFLARVCVCVCAHTHMHIHAGACRGQKKASDTLELHLEMVVSCQMGCWALNSSPLKTYKHS